MIAVSALLSAATVDAIPRDYNFARDLMERPRSTEELDRTAYVDVRGHWSYRQLRSRVDQFSRVIESLPVRPEERVVMCMVDTVDWPTVFLGILNAGRVAVPVDTTLTEDDYRAVLTESRARVLIVSQEVFPKFAHLMGSFYGLRVIVAGENNHGQLSLEDLLESTPARGPYRAPPTTRDDFACWLYTAGTTGRPKAVVHVHADLRVANDLYAGPILGLARSDVVYSVAKLPCAYGLANALVYPLSTGATTVLLTDQPSPEAVALILRRYKVSVFFGTPAFYATFLASAVLPARDQVTFRRCVSSGDTLPPEVGRRWSERFGCDIVDGLGSTEMMTVFLSNRPGEVRYGTSGKPVPGYEVRLVDDEGVVVKTRGMTGELQVRGPTGAVMYWNNRDLSRTTFLGEWTRSGDQYFEDEDGCFVFCGRRDDMLRAGGVAISPLEIEHVLLSHPEVLEAAVVAWPDDEQVFRPKAFVVLKTPDMAGQEIADALLDHCRQTLAHYKYPRWIEFRSVLPRTAAGTIQRFKLRAEVNLR
jgi:benzoate-CoA ligase family protein